MMAIASGWLLTLVLHASVLLTLAWLIERALHSTQGAWRETVWRAALFGAALTATAQMLAPPAPLGGRWQFATAAATSPPERHGLAAAAATPHRGSAPSAITPPAARPTVIDASLAATAAGAPAPAASDVDWSTWLAGLWLAGAVFALARLGLAASRLRRRVRRAAVASDPELLAAVRTLAQRAGVAAPRLLLLADLGSPIALTGRRIVLPYWAVATLDGDQVRAMIAHELGHLVRRDPAWKLLTAFWRAVLWFLPPVAFAQRRLDALAEIACDAFAAAQVGDGRSVAECLASCAEHRLGGYAFEIAPAMAASRSALLDRVERLLAGVYVDTSGSGAVARSVAGLVIALAAVCLPAFGFESAHARAPDAEAPQPPKPPAAQAAKPVRPSHSSVSLHSDDGQDTLTISSTDDDGSRFSAKVDGKIAFNDDETDVAGLSAGGSATFDETRAGVRRRLDLIEHGGAIDRRYYVDGGERPLDDSARAWTASIIKRLVRSGIGAEERTRRLYARGGAGRVLDEIAQIPTDYVRGIYLRELMALGTLTAAEVARAVELAGAMQSDYERRQALMAVFDKQALDESAQLTFLRQALRFDSDYERAELLVGVLPRLVDTGAVRQAWLDAALKIKSDYEHRRTLQAMLARSGLSDAQLATIIAASDSMQSDYEHRELLVDAAKRLHDPDAAAIAYARSAGRIASAYERREALLALIQSGKLGAAGAGAVLDAAATINSSYEQREVLVALARTMPADAGLLARYRAVAQRLGDYDREEAERALAR